MGGVGFLRGGEGETGGGLGLSPLAGVGAIYLVCVVFETFGGARGGGYSRGRGRAIPRRIFSCMN